MQRKGWAFFVLVTFLLFFTSLFSGRFWYKDETATAQKESTNYNGEIDQLIQGVVETTTGENLSWEFDYPDLAALPPSDFRLIRSKNGKIELRFSTAFWNSGEAPIELVGGGIARRSRDQDVEMKQRISLKDGSYLDLTVGPAHWHAVHNHYHFDEVALYTLEPLEGNLEKRVSSKMGYCMRDDLPKDRKIPGASSRQIYRLCGTTIQGLSVGWTDIYYWHYEGQSLDVTSLPAGNYRFRLLVDPEKKLIEKTRSNNIATVNIFLNPEKQEVKVLR